MNSTANEDRIKITNIILNQTGKFTLQDVHTRSIQEGVQMSTEKIKLVINNLRDSGLVSDFGNTYTLSRLML